MCFVVFFSFLKYIDNKKQKTKKKHLVGLLLMLSSVLNAISRRKITQLCCFTWFFFLNFNFNFNFNYLGSKYPFHELDRSLSMPTNSPKGSFGRKRYYGTKNTTFSIFFFIIIKECPECKKKLETSSLMFYHLAEHK